jgi:CRP-like cAMP-binding protein
MIFYDLFRNSPEFLEIKAGEVLLKEGDLGHEMYVLIQGKASIERGGMFFDEVGPGDFVGELAVIDGSPRLATTTAITDCKFVVVDRKRFEFLVAETPDFAIEVMRVLAHRLRRADQLRLQASQPSA